VRFLQALFVLVPTGRGSGGGRLTIGHVPISATNGVHTVKAAAKSFVLKAVADASCPSRVGLLSGTWKRKR
jgi:fructose-1,6-bisphosphatase